MNKLGIAFNLKLGKIVLSGAAGLDLMKEGKGG